MLLLFITVYVDPDAKIVWLFFVRVCDREWNTCYQHGKPFKQFPIVKFLLYVASGEVVLRVRRSSTVSKRYVVAATSGCTGKITVGRSYSVPIIRYFTGYPLFSTHV